MILPFSVNFPQRCSSFAILFSLYQNSPPRARRERRIRARILYRVCIGFRLHFLLRALVLFRILCYNGERTSVKQGDCTFMKTVYQHIQLPEHRRILMISDLHGHADGLRVLLCKARFSKDDILFIVGDLIEKGPQSLDVIRLVMELQKTHTIYPLMGNVELWRLETLQSDDPGLWREMAKNSLKCMEWWGGSLLHEMCAEIGVPLRQDTDIVPLIPLLRQRYSPEISFLSSLPTLLETDRFIFVHGGIPHEDLHRLMGTDAFPLLKFDDFYNAGLRFHKYVAVGHWPAVLYSKTYPDFNPIIDRERHILSLDGACGVKKEGQLNLVMLPDEQSEDFSFLTWDHLPVIRAEEGQAGSPPEKARYIRWNDHAVELIEKGEEISRVNYHGQLMDVPTQFIFFHHGMLSCADITDYVLPVSPGEDMFLILRLSTGCYVKKNGIAGWYYGRYTMKTEETI